MLVVALWHELGHAAASARYDSQPGDIGFGVYFIMPVFYSDVTRIWKLPRHQRVMVDLGGIYFQSFVMLAIYLTGVFLHNQYITFAVLMISLRMAFNLNPFIKMDGYWVLSDLIGIPNLQETTRNFIKTKTKQLLRMRYVPFVLNVNPKAKITFYLYLILSCAFFVYFAYWLILALHSAIVNLPSLYNTFKTIEFNNQIWWEYFINILVRVVYPNLIYFITIIFAVRYISPGFSKVFSLVKNGRTAKTKQTIQNDL
jgi:putative peptide zinc metalloprotease protein